MLILGIETSCDETAVAILEPPRNILASFVASQDDVHAKYGGVVPELASRRHIETIVPLINAALDRTEVGLNQLDGIAVTYAPGLIGALLVGLSVAKSIAYALGIPFTGVNHLEGHLNAIHLERADVQYPHIGMVVSGGHTSLYLVSGFGKYKLLGATRDDAAGEAFDKAAKLLGLGYPGGPAIEKAANDGDPTAIKFTMPKMGRGSQFDIAEFDFSFSGIKTAVALLVRGIGSRKQEAGNRKQKLHASCLMPHASVPFNAVDIAASFQSTVVEILTTQIERAAKKYKIEDVVVSGGVAANSSLRRRLADMAPEINCLIPSTRFCTDNAAMIAYVGAAYLKMGRRSDFSMNAVANEEIGV